MDEYYRNEMNRLVKARNAIDIAIADFEWLKASQAHQRAKPASSTKIRSTRAQTRQLITRIQDGISLI